MGNSEYILNCEGISKAFGGTQALKDVQLHVKPGEVHALLGENGAGKSTLMKCVIGLIKQDAGTMEFEGKPYQAKGPVDALNSGISMIHQELNPEPHLTVAESIFLKRENTKGIFLDKKAQNKRCQEILDQFDVPYTATTKMKELTLAQVQMVEIIKAVSCDSRLIIMDEPDIFSGFHRDRQTVQCNQRSEEERRCDHLHLPPYGRDFRDLRQRICIQKWYLCKHQKP